MNHEHGVSHSLNLATGLHLQEIKCGHRVG